MLPGVTALAFKEIGYGDDTTAQTFPFLFVCFFSAFSLLFLFRANALITLDLNSLFDLFTGNNKRENFLTHKALSIELFRWEKINKFR